MFDDDEATSEVASEASSATKAAGKAARAPVSPWGPNGKPQTSKKRWLKGKLVCPCAFDEQDMLKLPRNLCRKLPLPPRQLEWLLGLLSAPGAQWQASDLPRSAGSKVRSAPVMYGISGKPPQNLPWKLPLPPPRQPARQSGHHFAARGRQLLLLQPCRCITHRCLIGWSHAATPLRWRRTMTCALCRSAPGSQDAAGGSQGTAAEALPG